MAIRQIPSPNFGPRRGCDRPDTVVIHYTGMDTVAAACARLCDPGPEVSAHYLIGEDGAVIQLVDEAARAWHAGAGYWAGSRDVNSRSIGIELANPGPLAGHPPFPEPQMAALEALLAAIRRRWPIVHLVGHSDVAVGRKADPGPKFDWARLDPLPATAVADPPPLTAALTRLGYDPDAAPADRLRAFRLRFRPQAIGAPAEAADAALAAAIDRDRRAR